jgi:putative FmdB family regulatory protein
MPIYEYSCGACGYHYEAIQKISEAPLLECPACGQPALKKLISAAGFRLSGSGWYETDFKQTGQRNLAAKDSEKSKQEKASAPSGKTKSTDSSKSSQTDKSASSSG